MRIKDIFNTYYNALQEHYELHEARSSAYALMEYLHDVSRIDIVINPDKEVSTLNIGSTIEAIKEQTPIQYITGISHFMGYDFGVESGVLIPRPETEELVRMIIAHEPQAKNILDIGTGSGAISISLAKELTSATVTAYDISTKAIKIAQKNAEKLSVRNISFERVDILATDTLKQKFDIIVSNPPYITQQEKTLMRGNVLMHEPHIALFVPDDNPLLFYQKITQLAFKSLNIGGSLYFEINEAYGNHTVEMILKEGFSSCELFEDLFGKQRLIKAKR